MVVSKARAARPAPRRDLGPQRTKGETVPPVNTLKLMEHLGPTEAARRLGTSTTTLHKVKKHGLASKVIEVASEGELRKIVEGVQPAAAAPPVPAVSKQFISLLMKIEGDLLDSSRRVAEMRKVLEAP